MYRPLPDGLTIKNSPIEGLGLFTTINIKKNTFIGVTHIRDENLIINILERLWVVFIIIQTIQQ